MKFFKKKYSTDSDAGRTGLLLDVRHIGKSYYKNGSFLKAADDVSFTMKRGDCLGLAGESGSGKSTIAALITRQLHPDSGRIIFNGHEINGNGSREKRSWPSGIQMIFQSPQASFDPGKRLGISMGEGLRNRGASKKEVQRRLEELLPTVGLDPAIAMCYPHEVSGGQSQRAAIARALLLRPELLICDEATSALDALVQRQVAELLKKLQKEMNLSILFICHDLALVQDMCDHVLLMRNGRVIESGKTEDVLHRPEHPYTRELIRWSF